MGDVMGHPILSDRAMAARLPTVSNRLYATLQRYCTIIVEESLLH